MSRKLIPKIILPQNYIRKLICEITPKLFSKNSKLDSQNYFQKIFPKIFPKIIPLKYYQKLFPGIIYKYISENYYFSKKYLLKLFRK